MARPERFEPPTTWFVVTPSSLTFQLEQSLATLAAIANLTQLAEFLFDQLPRWHKFGTFDYARSQRIFAEERQLPGGRARRQPFSNAP